MTIDPAAALQQLTNSKELLGLAHLPVWSDIAVDAIVPGVTLLVDQVRSEFAQIKAGDNATWESLMVPLERLEHKLWQPLSRIGHLQAVNFKQDRQEAYDQVRPLAIAMQTEIDQSEQLYTCLNSLVKAPNLSSTQKRILEERIKAMRHTGVHLQTAAKQQFQSWQQALSEKQVVFQNNLVKQAQTQKIEVTDPSEVSGLPQGFLQAALVKENSAEGDYKLGPWSFSVSGASYVTILEQGKSQTLREKMYRAFRSRGTSDECNNKPVLEEILKLRQDQARLLGFNHFAALSLDKKMAPSIQAVHQLMGDLKVAAIPAAERELAELKQFVSDTSAIPKEALNLQPWDIAYWVERYRQSHFNIDQEEVRQYLQVPRVMQSLFDLMHTLFEIEIEEVPQGTVPVWHSDVRFYLVKEQEKVIAGFYMDAYERPGSKREGAWMNTVVDRSLALAPKGQAIALPVALFVMNARTPEQGKPGLFSLNDAETLFHEFGHALQHMLTRVDEGAASGINMVEWDAVEIASQFNENWLYQKTLLQAISAHVETGEALDEKLIDNILKSRHYWAGNATLRQLQFALTDLAIHESVEFDAESESLIPSPYKIESTIRDELIRTPFLPEESQLPAFSHLFAGGYAAGYYSYKWAEVMAADAFGLFEEIPLEDLDRLKSMAQKYRNTLLAKGGSQPAIEVFREYRGRDATVDALLKQQGLHV